MKKKIFVLLVVVVALMLSGCFKKNQSSTTDPQSTTTTQSGTTTTQSGSTTTQQTTTQPKPSEPTVIVFANHAQSSTDPTYKDPTTGEYNDAHMAPAIRQAKLQALDTVLQELNVKIEFTQYPGDVREVILQSVLANDPIGDIVQMWDGSQGTVFAQNVLQDLTEFRHLFDGEEWMLGVADIYGKTLGFTHTGPEGFPYWPLFYNITLIQGCELIPTDEDGDAILPSQLWEEGNWTWATFKDYLSKLKQCYTDRGITSPNRNYVIHAYEEDYRFGAYSMISANGGFLLKPDGSIGILDDNFIEAVEFFQELKREELLFTWYSGEEPGWLWNGYDFARGETVFTSMPNWYQQTAASNLTGRGELMGMVPFPIGPSAKENPEQYPYHLPVTGGNVLGIPKGVSKERAELAIRAYIMYTVETYKNLGDYESTTDYFNAKANETAAQLFPTSHEKYGESLKKSYQDYLAAHSTFDAGQMLGILAQPFFYTDINNLVKTPTTDARTYFQAKYAEYEAKVAALREIIDSDEIHDNMKPVIKLLPNAKLNFALNTDFEEVNWANYLEAYDIGDDRELTIADATFNFANIDATKPGTGKFKVTLADKHGNTAEAEFSVNIYDPDEEVAPVIELKDPTKPIQITVNTNLASVNISTYVSVYDKYALADGTILEGQFDLISYLKVDVSGVDVSQPGVYDLILSVTDFAGNETELIVEIEVVEPQE